MTYLEQSLSLARANLGRSVSRINDKALAEAADKLTGKDSGNSSGPHPFGIKNTLLPGHLVDRLRHHPDFLWLTVDKMADLGRSVDTDLINPLTYRLMTGSSSGGCVNILKGINQLCLGTDGGGSVLAPALSTNLYSFMGKGCGWSREVENGASVSTDGLTFTPGLGIIASRFDVLKKAAEVLAQREFFVAMPESGQGTVRVLIPGAGCLPLPGGRDARAILDDLLHDLPESFRLREHCWSNPYDRLATVKEINAVFEADATDLILTYEGPVDVFGYDETIPRAFTGPAVKEITGNGKALIKAANICGCSAFTIPGPELAAGCVILCGQGIDKADKGFALASALAARLSRPELFERYFVRREKFVEECDIY